MFKKDSQARTGRKSYPNRPGPGSLGAEKRARPDDAAPAAVPPCVPEIRPETCLTLRRRALDLFPEQRLRVRCASRAALHPFVSTMSYPVLAYPVAAVQGNSPREVYPRARPTLERCPACVLQGRTRETPNPVIVVLSQLFPGNSPRAWRDLPCMAFASRFPRPV